MGSDLTVEPVGSSRDMKPQGRFYRSLAGWWFGLGLRDRKLGGSGMDGFGADRGGEGSVKGGHVTFFFV